MLQTNLKGQCEYFFGRLNQKGCLIVLALISVPLLASACGLVRKPQIAITELRTCQKSECTAKARCRDVRRNTPIVLHGEHSWAFTNDCAEDFKITVEVKLFDSESHSSDENIKTYVIPAHKSMKGNESTQFEATYGDGTRDLDLTSWTIIRDASTNSAVSFCEDRCVFTVR